MTGLSVDHLRDLLNRGLIDGDKVANRVWLVDESSLPYRQDRQAHLWYGHKSLLLNLAKVSMGNPLPGNPLPILALTRRCGAMLADRAGNLSKRHSAAGLDNDADLIRQHMMPAHTARASDTALTSRVC